MARLHLRTGMLWRSYNNGNNIAYTIVLNLTTAAIVLIQQAPLVPAPDVANVIHMQLPEREIAEVSVDHK